MFTKQQHTSRFIWTVPALLLLGLTPATSQAEVLLLRNNSPMPIVVQITAAFQGNIQRPPPITINPRMTSPPITLVGNKYIVIYDAANRTRVLYRDTIPASNVNRAFLIQPNPPFSVKLQMVPFNQVAGGK